MKYFILIFLLFNFTTSHAFDKKCEQILSGDDNNNWLITYSTTKDAIQAHCDLNQLKTCDSIASLVPMPAITCAIETGQFSAMRIMLDAKVDLNAKDKNGLTPLMHSIWATEDGGSFPRALITGGADLNARDNSNRTAVYYAHLAGNTKVEAEIIREDFDKKNPCSFSYENLCSYYFIAQAETAGSDPSDINAIAAPGTGKAIGRAIMSGYVSAQAKKEWQTFLEKAKPFTSESYYQSTCSVANQSRGGGNSKKVNTIK
jgi:hypothetical protein